VRSHVISLLCNQSDDVRRSEREGKLVTALARFKLQFVTSSLSRGFDGATLLFDLKDPILELFNSCW
jgi:hypothetical protein